MKRITWPEIESWAASNIADRELRQDYLREAREAFDAGHVEVLLWMLGQLDEPDAGVAQHKPRTRTDCGRNNGASARLETRQ